MNLPVQRFERFDPTKHSRLVESMDFPGFVEVPEFVIQDDRSYRRNPKFDTADFEVAYVLKETKKQ